jgi:hypothetical protein
MPFNWGLLFLVVAVSAVVLGLALGGMYLLNRDIDSANR